MTETVTPIWSSALLGSLLLHQNEIRKSELKINRESYFEVFFRPDFFIWHDEGVNSNVLAGYAYFKFKPTNNISLLAVSKWPVNHQCTLNQKMALDPHKHRISQTIINLGILYIYYNPG